MPEVSMRLNASAAPQWLQCARRADFDQRDTFREPEGQPVHLVLGNLVHQQITGVGDDMPRLIRYDRLTPSERELHRQVADMVTMVRRVLAQGYTVLDTERRFELEVVIGEVLVVVVGKPDLIAQRGDGRRVFLDLKTGALTPRGALAQMAIYAWAGIESGHDLAEVTIIHCPRGGRDWEPITRPAKELAAEAMPIIRHVARSAEVPLPGPGIHCEKCRNFSCLFNPRYSK